MQPMVFQLIGDSVGVALRSRLERDANEAPPEAELGEAAVLLRQAMELGIALLQVRKGQAGQAQAMLHGKPPLLPMQTFT